MINTIKRGLSEADKATEDAKIRALVESTLSEIEKDGDKAVSKNKSETLRKRSAIPCWT